MRRADGDSSGKERKKTTSWVITVFFTTLVVSGAISLLSEELLANSGIAAAFVILLAIVVVGIAFDIIGVAVTSADERPFHSMAARKVPGAQEAIRLLRNAERVSSICNDVVGDICGVVSGAASASIASRMIVHFSFSWPRVITLVMSAMIAGLTVGGKAAGKAYAINSCTSIVHSVGRMIGAWNRFCSFFRKKKKVSKDNR